MCSLTWFIYFKMHLEKKNVMTAAFEGVWAGARGEGGARGGAAEQVPGELGGVRGHGEGHGPAQVRRGHEDRVGVQRR